GPFLFVLACRYDHRGLAEIAHRVGRFGERLAPRADLGGGRAAEEARDRVMLLADLVEREHPVEQEQGVEWPGTAARGAGLCGFFLLLRFEADDPEREPEEQEEDDEDDDDRPDDLS